MKKLLALVLALVMTLGLATVGANAVSYSDDADISYEEAVDVMSALGVFDGQDGKFNPKGTLTREQGAKIIAYMILGKKAADSLSTAGAPFDDVAADRWSAGAIAYCTSEKIIGGVGGNKFNPEGELTGYAFAKMLLVALGYNPQNEGLVGDSWSINTAKLAISAGLKKGGLNNLVMGDGITREEACQMAFNTEKADLVQYPNNTVIQTGDVTVTSTSKATKIAWDADDHYDKTVNDNTTKQFCEEYASDLVLKNNDPDEFGRPASNWWNGTTEIGTYASGADYSYSGKVTRGTLYSVYGKTNINNLSKEGGTTLTVYVDGYKALETENDTAENRAAAAEAAENYFKSGSSAAIGANTDANGWGAPGAGSKTEVFINDDNDITIVIINEYLVQAAANYNTSTKSLTVKVPTGAATPGDVAYEYGNTYKSVRISNDDIDVSGVKKDDYLIVTAAADDEAVLANYVIQTVAPATKLVGTVSTYIGDKNVTIDGTTYTYAGNAASGDGNENGKLVAYTVGQQATVVLDADNNIIYVKEAVTNSNWVFLYEVGKKGNLGSTAVADAYFTDGTNTEITLSKLDGEDIEFDGDDPQVDAGWYTYTVASGKYKLTSADAGENGFVVSDDDVDDELITNGAITIGTTVAAEGGDQYSANSNASKGNSSTIFVVKKNSTTVNVYTGVSNVPTIKVKTAETALKAYYREVSGFAKQVFVDASKGKIVTQNATDSDLIWLLGNDTKGGVVDANDNTYYTYSALVDGAQTTINIAKTADGMTAYNNTTELGKLYNDAKTDSNNYIDSLTSVMEAEANTTRHLAGVTFTAEGNQQVKYSNGVLTLPAEGGQNAQEYVVASDATVYLAVYAKDIMDDAGNDYELTITDANGLATELAGYTVTAASYKIITTSNTSDTIKQLYIAVNGVDEIDD